MNKDRRFSPKKAWNKGPARSARPASPGFVPRKAAFVPRPPSPVSASSTAPAPKLSFRPSAARPDFRSRAQGYPTRREGGRFEAKTFMPRRAPAPTVMKAQEETSWGSVAPWYNDMLEQKDGTYQKEVILPNLLRVMEPKPEEAIIDIACGQGFFSRVLAEAGAHVTGSDISPELIALAQNNVPKAAFHVSPAEKLAYASDGYFHKAVIVLAIQNIKGVEKAMKEAFRVLRPDGRLFLVLNHPAFRIPQNSDWGFDEKKGVQFRRTDKYLSELSVPIVMNPGQKESEKTVSFHRPMQFYFKELRKAGFAVARLEEWISHKKSEKGPRQAAEDVARKEFPMFLLLEAIKLLK